MERPFKYPTPLAACAALALPPPLPFVSFPCTPPPPNPSKTTTAPSFPTALVPEPRVWEVEGLGASFASAMPDTGARGRGDEPEPVTPQQQAEETQAVDDRRLLRSQYLAVKGLISGRTVLPCETR